MLSKLKILGFRDKELRTKVSEYSLQINPESYSHTHSAEFGQNEGVNTAGGVLKFNTHPQQTLKFDFTLDSTGVVPGVSSVPAEIKKFKDLVYTYQGKIHSPNYLKVLWGGLAFNCMLASMDVTYELFSPSGKPLRAKLAASFSQHQTPKEIELRAGKKSADLTHAEVVVAGTTLPLMTHRVYDNSELYVHVARANDLNDLMHLAIGSEIRLPPARDQADE